MFRPGRYLLFWCPCLDGTCCFGVQTWMVPVVLVFTPGRYLLFWCPRLDGTCCFGVHTWTVPVVLVSTPGRYLLFWCPPLYGTCCFGVHTWMVALQACVGQGSATQSMPGAGTFHLTSLCIQLHHTPLKVLENETVSLAVRMATIHGLN